MHRAHYLGPHPIITHFLERLMLEGILRGRLGSARQGVLDHARTLAVLVHNLLVSPGPLYRIATWLASVEPAVLRLTPTQAAAINDDRVARALDGLTSERGRSLWFRLALRLIKQFELATHRFHHDTTTVTFHGAYARPHGAPQIVAEHVKSPKSEPAALRRRQSVPFPVARLSRLGRSSRAAQRRFRRTAEETSAMEHVKRSFAVTTPLGNDESRNIHSSTKNAKFLSAGPVFGVF